ncbi:hypothetical protein NDU88_006868 [Pleurodeles waltl]|uniref:Uncharacterized protein n=1 Tax=Pleurodeles waltl TaxID=8319 RepID=A0AAV7PK38_PLEWA|nr:hypothetical protein NDU88_006868 [Pleurodeles waltl]
MCDEWSNPKAVAVCEDRGEMVDRILSLGEDDKVYRETELISSGEEEDSGGSGLGLDHTVENLPFVVIVDFDMLGASSVVRIRKPSFTNKHQAQKCQSLRQCRMDRFTADLWKQYVHAFITAFMCLEAR